MSRPALLYVSNGNIPSRWAHTVQTMKMSEALAGLVPSFRLLVASSLGEWLAPRTDLLGAYGVTRPFEIARVPLWLWRREPTFESTLEPRFKWVAPALAAWLRPALVWTRAQPLAEACAARGLPVIFERHSPSSPERVARLAQIVALPSFRGIVTNSESLVAELAASGVSREKLLAARNAVDPTPSAPRKRESSGPPVALYAGSLSESKGLPTLLAAAALLPDVRFAVLGGSADDVAHWRAHAGANVEFRGHVPHAELARHFAAADVGLYPNSARDPLARSSSPLKVHEYVAAGLPIVAAAIPAVTGWLRDGENAFLHPPDDPAGLAAALALALADPERARALAARAQSELGGFTWTDRARSVLARFAPEILS